MAAPDAAPFLSPTLWRFFEGCGLLSITIGTLEGGEAGFPFSIGLLVTRAWCVTVYMVFICVGEQTCAGGHQTVSDEGVVCNCIYGVYMRG